MGAWERGSAGACERGNVGTWERVRVCACVRGACVSFGGTTWAAYGSSIKPGWAQWLLYRSQLVVDPASNDCSACVGAWCSGVHVHVHVRSYVRDCQFVCCLCVCVCGMCGGSGYVCNVAVLSVLGNCLRTLLGQRACTWAWAYVSCR